MPQVKMSGGKVKHYPYTKKGKASAAKARKRLKKKPKRANKKRMY